MLRAQGLPPESCAVLLQGRSVPLDTVLNDSCELTVVRTFSGG
jgi:sulfur carrier protein ThiS